MRDPLSPGTVSIIVPSSTLPGKHDPGRELLKIADARKEEAASLGAGDLRWEVHLDLITGDNRIVYWIRA